MTLALSGCADWPRFANLPEIEAVPQQSQVAFVATDLEGVASERPCDAAGLGAPTSGVGEWFDAIEYRGTLEPHGRIGVRTLNPSDNGIDVSCGSDQIPACATPSGLPLRYTGDVDWVSFEAQSRPLCIAYRFTNSDCNPGACEWDMPLLKYSSAQTCITGSFIGPADVSSQTLPAVVGDAGSIFLSLPSDHPDAALLGHMPDQGLYALYVAGAEQDENAGTTDYHIAVAHVPTAEACASLLDALPVTGDSK